MLSSLCAFLKHGAGLAATTPHVFFPPPPSLDVFFPSSEAWRTRRTRGERGERGERVTDMANAIFTPSFRPPCTRPPQATPPHASARPLASRPPFLSAFLAVPFLTHTRLQGVGFPKPTPLVSENQRQETNSPSENKETGDRRSHYFYRENQPLSAENQPQAAAPRRPSAAPTPAVPGVLELNKGVAHPSRSDCRFWLAGCHAVQRSQKQRAICKGGG
jgi:hypothetical protein